MNKLIKVFFCSLIFTIYSTESPLKTLAALHVEHDQTDSLALQYCYRWTDNQTLVTHKSAFNKTAWNIHANTQHGLTITTPEWQAYSKIIKSENENPQITRKIDNVLFILDLKTKKYADPYNVWEHGKYQPKKPRMYLRPDEKQYAFTTLTPLPEEEFVYNENLAIFESKTTIPVKTFISKTFYNGACTPIPSLKFDFSTDNKILAVVDTFPKSFSSVDDTGDRTESINLYNTTDFSETQLLTVENGGVEEISISPNSDWLAAYLKYRPADRRTDETSILLWNIVTGRLVAELNKEHFGKRTISFEAEMTSLGNIWSPNSKRVATYSENGATLVVRELPHQFEGER